MLDRHKSVWPEGVPHHLDLPEQTLTQNLINAAAQYAQRPAVIYHGNTLTYAQLSQQVDALAGYLQNVAGVTRGDRVLLYMQNSAHFVIGYYAILRADAVVIPVNPMSRHAELQHYARDAGADVMLAGQELTSFATPLVDEGLLNTIIVGHYGELADPGYDIPLPAPMDTLDPAAIAGPGVVRWSDAVARGERPAAPQATPDDLAVIPYSSGTTGQPKGCVHTHRTVQVTLVGSLVWNPMTEHDISLTVLPLFHVTGMQAAMNSPLYSGGCLVIMTRWNRVVAAELIKRYHVTRWRSISTMVIDLLNDPDFARYDLSSLTAVGGGGAPMPEAIAKRLKGMTGLDYIEGYGLSETMAALHMNPPAAAKRQCLGIPIFDVDSRILGVSDGAQLGPNEVGEIVTSAPQVFLGYWQNEEATKQAFFQLDGKTFFRTGDLGYYDEDGYFFMVDRVKRMINAAGFKVWPAEVEALMHRNPDIAEVCIIGTPDPRRGETVKAYVVLTAAAQNRVTAQDIIEWCKTEMAAYKCPRDIAFVDALPKSASGKVLWRALQDQERANLAQAEAADG
ncbi:long-chain-fatty-acid--CoA ligase [Thalassovita taeanensis]|uniref:Fatty-acyl-CoA synthase n=1 Tax=Thalassovita taeanensis TaxID=657014 RepID=A0A1H9B7F9_9RHOB|nr:long-chain-fatty-acid--CoA ligase [Thalassovita taeanensis]SEP84894.1 fatty-acyl-CoA synthase [Thalassovita taeanensis]